MNFFDRVFQLNPTWRDAIDILIVALIIYYILALIRGTRAMQISIGLVLLGSTTFVARAFDLPSLEAISRQILFYLPFAAIVLFQQEIRRALAGMVGDPMSILLPRQATELPVEPLLNACEILAGQQTGALIAIEGRQTLRMYEEGARPLDALVSAELLIAIFTPGNPLHDGAVIVRGRRVVVASAFLPLGTVPDAGFSHGTRHRAALGLSEESDAFVIVISEENGSIAVATDGVLHEHLDRVALGRLLTGWLGGAR